MAVTWIGVLSLITGVGQAIIGLCLLQGGRALAVPTDPIQGFLLQLSRDMLIASGVLLLLQGAAGMVAGTGVLQRKPWGLVLAAILAILSLLWAGPLLFSIQTDAGLGILGAVQAAYSIAVLVILFRHRAEFAGRKESLPVANGIKPGPLPASPGRQARPPG